MTDSNSVYIYNIIYNIINNNNLNSISSEDLKTYMDGLQNPNDLDLVYEFNAIDQYLQKNPKKAFWWREDWQNRLQAWIIRTQRPNRPKAAPIVQQKPETEPSPEPITTAEESSLSGDSVKLLQGWLNRWPMLYALYPSIYSVIPFPKEWQSPDHWGYYCRHYRQGYSHLNNGPIPLEIQKRYKITAPQQTT